MCVLMLAYPTDLKNGVSKLLLKHNTLLGVGDDESEL